MHSRFPAGWRFTLWTAVLATLILLPCSTATADSPRTMTGSAETGFAAVDRQPDDDAMSRVSFARANYMWPYAVGPSYGEVERAARRVPGVLHTAVGSFDLGRGELNIPAELKTTNRLTELGLQYFVIALDQQASSPEMAQLVEQSGGAVVRWIPVSSMIARLTPAAMSALQGRSDVIAIEPYHPAFKLDPSIGRVPLNDPVKALSEVYTLDVRIFRGENAEAVAESLTRLGGNVLSIYPDTVRVELNRAKLADLAALQPVRMIWEALPLHPHAEETTTMVQTGRWNQGAVPYHDAGVDGSGGGLADAQVLMALDTGIQLDNGDLSDTRTDTGTVGTSHRKVLRYETTIAYGGDGDTLGCDAPAQGGFTHGHFVSAVALGNATAVDEGYYGDPWYALDQNENVWKLDGVAPGAMLVHFDGQRTPVAVSCADPLYDTVSPGDLYSYPSSGSMHDSYTNNGARVFNFSWGSDNNTYSVSAEDIDDFLDVNRDAMVFCSAGNYGLDEDPADGIWDEGSLGSTANTKNGLAIGAHNVANDLGGAWEGDDRANFSSLGPTGSGNRVAPQLMAPGNEDGGGDQGLANEFGCRSSDNDGTGAVECDIISGIEGTSFSSPAAAGAALLVRDYFAQGFYPDGTSSNPGNSGDQVANISGALIKAVLIDSAHFMAGQRLSWPHRFNNEQGYGRIQLDNVLPLENWPASATGLIVADGGIVGGVGNLSGLDGVINASLTETDSADFEVCDTDQELRVTLAWTEGSGTALINDLDLEVQSPSGEVYYGNYFTDDKNESRALEAGEDCPSIDGGSGTIDGAAWSLPTVGCVNAEHDTENPTEAVMLSPDYNGDGENDLDPADDNQLELGTWTVRVSTKGIGSETQQRYAVAIAGGVCLGSSVRFDTGAYTCNSVATVTVSELAETGDMTPDASTVAGRTVIQVLDPDDVVVDSESGSDLGFTQPDVLALKFVADNVILTDGTAYDSGNGVLDVRTGDRVQVVYSDVDSSGLPDPDKVRRSTASVHCSPRLAFGDIVFADYGQDMSFFVDGGCERNARGMFEFGYPDKYMDAQELVSYNFAFASNEDEDMANVDVNLRCLVADTDSPEDCRPNTDDCPDPNRLNNESCDGSGDPGDPVYMTILDTPKTIGLIPGGAAIAANFSISMMPAIPGTPEVDLLLEVTSRTSGKTTTGLAVNRHRLDVDENNLFYSTDFPTGGTEIRDYNNNETIQNPTTNFGDWLYDYRFETIVWSDLTAGGTKNTGLQSPWNFDTNDGGFLVGLGAPTDEASIGDVIAQWGEDKNFNNLDDGYCNVDTTVHCYNDADCTAVPGAGTTCVSIENRDPTTDGLTKSWGTAGGCGWQTREAGELTGGIWHTGRIYGTTGTCLVSGNDVGQCQGYETVSGSGGQLAWFELLVTPVMQKVNGEDYTIEIMDWAWNQAIDLADSNASWTWELDTDITRLEPVDLKSDFTVLNGGNGGYGAVASQNNPSLTNGFSVFTPVQGNCYRLANICKSNDDCAGTCNDGTTLCDSHDDCRGGTNFCDICVNPQNAPGKLGNNRPSANSCFFLGADGIKPEAMLELGLPKPLDDDIDNDSDGVDIDEYVFLTGPIRNMDVYAFNGWDMRWNTLEDIYGDTGDFFQAAIGMVNLEKAGTSADDPITSYGIGVDDMVVQWREYNFIDDATDCVSGGECAVIDLATSNLYEGNTLLTVTVLEKTPPALNDCDWDTSTGATTDDCDSDGVRDVVVKATSENEIAGEIIFLNQVSGSPNEYKANLAISANYDATGVLFVQPQGSDNPFVTVLYMDDEDGSGQPCKLAPDPVTWGRVENSTQVFLVRGQLVLVNASLTDNGDNDGWADGNETVQMTIELANQTGVDLTAIGARLATNDPKIDCVINPGIEFGDLAAGESAVSTSAFEFKVGDVQRTGTCLTGGQVCIGDGDCDPGDSCNSTLADFSVEFAILLKSGEFDASLAPQKWIVDLDLDAELPATPVAGVFLEGFETGTFGGMTTMNLDDGRNSEEASEGFRCQYSDPDWMYSNSYEQSTDCYLAATPQQAEHFFWQISDGLNTDTDPGRAYEGRYSVYMGQYLDDLLGWTTPMASLEGLQTFEPMNIGVGRVCETTRTTICDTELDCPGGEACVDVQPELSYVYQVSYADARCVNVSGATRSADGGAVGMQFVNVDDSPASVWYKLSPYTNVYDMQKEDNYTNCFFDPIDDGNTEDDFFDPTDPYRRLGPSTMCFPEFSYCNMGSTDGDYSPDDVGNGDPGSGLQGSYGPGTWVQSRLNLSRFKGQRIRIRFINSSIKNGTDETMEMLFEWNPIVCDDGWWVDNIKVTDALLGEPAIVTADIKDNSGLPGCGSNCDTVTADLVADPAGTLPAPGQLVELAATGSYANRCMGGTLQYRFWIDGDGDSDGEEGTADTLVRGWTDNPLLLQAPLGTSTYVVNVRCTSDHSCEDSTFLEVPVNCPASGNLVADFETVTASGLTALEWTTATTYNYGQGLLSALDYNYNTITTGTDVGPATSHDLTGTPPAGDGWWYLFKAAGASGGYCNEGSTYGSATRDAELP